MHTVLSVDTVFQMLGQRNTILLDCRFMLGNPTYGLELYRKGHIPGAFYVDLEKDLSSNVTEHGGRHPLPSVEQLTKIFSDIGIDTSTIVIAYDNQDGAMASRLWWLLTYCGHQQVYIMEQGYSCWVDKGYPTTQIEPTAIR